MHAHPHILCLTEHPTKLPGIKQINSNNYILQTHSQGRKSEYFCYEQLEICKSLGSHSRKYGNCYLLKCDAMQLCGQIQYVRGSANSIFRVENGGRKNSPPNAGTCLLHYIHIPEYNDLQYLKFYETECCAVQL
jgi:hypothetical protein